MAQTLMRFDFWVDWDDRVIPFSGPGDRLTRWAGVMTFSFGQSSMYEPIDGKITMNNLDGRFTPYGKSLYYPREVLIAPHKFKVAIEGEPDSILVDGLIQRSAAQEGNLPTAVFELTAITTRNLEVLPRYEGTNGGNSLLFLDSIARAAGTTVDPNRAQRPPTNIEGLIEWPPVTQINVDSLNPTFPVWFAAAEWTTWCNQPIYVLRDGRLGTAHPGDLTNPNKRIINSEDLIINDNTGLKAIHQPAHHMINNVIYADGYDDLTEAVVPRPPSIPRIQDFDPEDRAMLMHWNPSTDVDQYIVSINNIEYPPLSSSVTSFRFDSLGPGGDPLSPGTRYTFGVFARNAHGDSNPDFDTVPTSVLPPPPRRDPQPPGEIEALRVVSAVINTAGEYVFSILWEGPLDTATTDVAESFDFDWVAVGGTLGPDENSVTPGFSGVTEEARIVVRVRSRNRVDVSRYTTRVFDLDLIAGEDSPCSARTGLDLTLTGNRATATWDALNVATSYSIQWRTTTATSFADNESDWQNAIEVFTNSAGLFSVPGGVLVQFRVFADCPGALGQSPWAYSPVRVSTAPRLTTPVLNDITETATTRPLSWTVTDDANVGSWEYRFGTGDWEPIPSSTRTTRSYTLTGQAPNSTVTVQVRSVPANAVTHQPSLPSNAVTSTTPTQPGPGDPVVLVSESTNTVIFRYAAAPGVGDTATARMNYRWRSGTGAWSNYVQVTTDGFFSVPSPRQGITYGFQIYSENSSGIRSNVIGRTGILDPPTPFPPGPLQNPSTNSDTEGVSFNFLPPLDTGSADPATAFEWHPTSGTATTGWTRFGTGVTTTLRVTGSANTTIVRYIRGWNAQGGGPATRFSGRVVPPATVAPGSPSVSAVANPASPSTGVLFTLTAGTGTTEGYEVSENGTSNWSKLPDNATTHLVTVLPSSTPQQITRFFRAYNLDANNDELYSPTPYPSASATPTVPPAVLPNAPNAVGVAAFSTTVVRWTITAGTGGGVPTSFEVATSSAGPWTTITDAQAGIAGTQYEETVTASATPTTLTRFFRARNSTGPSNPPHTSASAIAQADLPTSLDKPTNLAQANQTTTSFRVTHSSVNNAAGYQYRYLDEEVERQFPVTIDDQQWSDTYFELRTPVITGLSPNRTYKVQIRAVAPAINPSVFSDPSDTSRFSTMAATVDPVTNERVVLRTDDEILVAWRKPAAYTVNEIERFDIQVNGGTPYRVANTAESTRVGAGTTGNPALDPATDYTIGIRVVLRGGRTSEYVTVTGRTLPAAPALGSQNVLGGSFELTWPAAAGAQYYEWSLDGRTWERVVDTSAPFVQYIGPPYEQGDSFILSNRIYSPRVRSVNGDDTNSATIDISTLDTLSTVHAMKVSFRTPGNIAGLDIAYKQIGDLTRALTASSTTRQFVGFRNSPTNITFPTVGTLDNAIAIPEALGVVSLVTNRGGTTIDIQEDNSNDWVYGGSRLVDGALCAIWVQRNGSSVTGGSSYRIVTEFAPHFYAARRASLAQILIQQSVLTLVTLPVGAIGVVRGATAASQVASYSRNIAAFTTIARWTAGSTTVPGLSQAATATVAGIRAAQLGAAAQSVGYGLLSVSATVAIPSAGSGFAESFEDTGADQGLVAIGRVMRFPSSDDRQLNIYVPLIAGTVSNIERSAAIPVNELSNFTYQDDALQVGSIPYGVYTNSFGSAAQISLSRFTITASATGWR